MWHASTERSCTSGTICHISHSEVYKYFAIIGLYHDTWTHGYTAVIRRNIKYPVDMTKEIYIASQPPSLK